MTRRVTALLALAAAMIATPGLAVPGGPLGTLPIGRYVCELPGDAAGPAGRLVPEAGFAIVSASSYRADGVRGTYLLTGDKAVMTGGPHKGKTYRHVSRGYLRLIEADGELGELRCVRATRNNS